VLSVGRKRGRLYLGSRLALLQVAGHTLLTLEYPPTLPLSAALQQLALKSKQQGIDLNRIALDVDLSAGLCRGVVLPSGGSSFELASLSSEKRQAIAQQLPWPLEQCVWPSGSANSGLLPVTTQGLMRNLSAWTAAQKVSLSTVQALWAVVTQSQRAKPAAVQSVALAEPDGVVFARSASPQRQAAWHFAARSETVTMEQKLQDAMTIHQMAKGTTAVFQFHANIGFGSEAGLDVWAGHWGQV
jgi:hypothetical protein